ncbi:uncharacterized protein LOC143526126 [Brachyhypopomus gauderio]|uniref:uncharacterized protein LOC143526126 n=1 Tax=Brachyhypopomus gauderio TaxID=698409 RepID=UPI0040420335
MNVGASVFQKREGGASEHCSVPLCSVSSRYNSVVSFHSFPEDETLRKKWLKIRRENFAVTKHTKVCSTHFTESDFVVGTSRRRLKKGSVPGVFEWNRHTQTNPRLSVWERRERPCNVSSLDDGSAAELRDVSLQHHDYDATPEPGAVDLLIMKNKELEEQLQQLKAKLEDLSVKQRFGLQRFVGSDDDIRFYTRFATYDHLMAFWSLIEPSTSKMLRVGQASGGSHLSALEEALSRPTKLTPIDELFLFLMYLSVGLKQRDLGHRFFIHRTTVSRIIITWANFLYTLLGSVCIWMPPEVIKAHLPKEFSRYPDTQVVIDCTEHRCQTPSSLLLQSEVFSTYKSHCTFKGMLGMAPHGAVTFVSALYQGSISDKEIFRQSGITSLLTPDMAIMVDKGFLVDDLVPCKVHRPAFLHKRTQMLEDDVRETQHIARLRVHVERMIRRIKENKLFDTVIPLSITGSINQIFTVACLLSNYQNGPLVKKWASDGGKGCMSTE